MKPQPIKKIQQVSNKLDLTAKVYMRDDTISTKSGIVNLHPSVGPHWVMLINEYYFDSFGCPPPNNNILFINLVTLANNYEKKNIRI